MKNISITDLVFVSAVAYAAIKTWHDTHNLFYVLGNVVVVAACYVAGFSDGLNSQRNK
jgi:hypothetical protein